MPIRDNLGTRMKEFYETILKTRLPAPLKSDYYHNNAWAF